MAAWVEASTGEMGQSLINPDEPSVAASALPGDTGKSELIPKSHFMPKPFVLQRNATVRSIQAPKTNLRKELNRAASSEMPFDITKPDTGVPKPSESLKSGSNDTVNGTNQSAAPIPVPLIPKPDLMAKAKPESTKTPGSNNQTSPNSKPGVTAEDVKDVQPRSRAKSLGSQDQKILSQKVQGEAAKTDADVKMSSKCWPPRNRLAMELTSKFESPSQPEKEVRRDAETSKTEKDWPPRSPSESSSSKPLMEKEETGDEEVSVKRRISLLCDQYTAAQHRDTFNKRDNPRAEISVDIKQRIQNLSSDAPRTRLPSTGAPKSPPSEKTQSTSDEPLNERSSEKPAATDKMPGDKSSSTTEIKNAAANVENEEEEEDNVAIPVYQRMSLDAEKKRREEEEKQRKDEQSEKERQQRERERLLEEERKAREIERQKEEKQERKQEEEKQRQMEERRKQEEEQIKEERKEEERRRQAKEERERQIEEEKRRIQEEKERLREEERLEKLKKEKEMEERKRMEEERLKEEERLRQEREKERLQKEKQMEEERRRIQEMERLKEEERLRQEREKERLQKEKEMEEERRRIQEMERLKEEERMRQEREKERLQKEKEMEEEQRRIKKMERQKEEERLRQEQEEERLQKEKEMEEEQRRIKEMERLKEEERLRQEREKERQQKEKEMEEERRRIQEMERQKEEERLRQEREKERLQKEKEMEEERRRIQEMERQKEEERLRQEREKVRLQKEKEMEEERRRIQEMERKKEEERLRQEREKERLQKEREIEERKQMEEERQREEERLRQEREKERQKKEKAKEEERQRIQELERQEEEDRLRKERENEMEMETCHAEVPTSHDLISFDAEGPAVSQTLVSTVQAADVSPLLTEVIYDDFSVKPRRWGTRARRASTPSPSREPPAAPDHSLQPESKSSDPGSQEPYGDQVYVHDLIGSEPEAYSPQNSTESRKQSYLFEESKPEDPLEPEPQSDEGQLKDAEPEEDAAAEQDTENLIEETDEQNENSDTVDGLARINQVLQRLTQKTTSTDSDTEDVPIQEEAEPLPVLETAAPLPDSSVYRSKVALGKKRSIKRSRPSRSIRQKATLLSLTEGTQPDWRFCDSTEAKDPCSNEADSESEEEPSQDVTSSPAPSQPKRVPMFPGMDPSALMAQLKRRSGVAETVSPAEAQTSPSVPTRSPRTHTSSLGPRVLPPVDNSGSGSSPSWLLELKSKKRMNQPESEA